MLNPFTHDATALEEMQREYRLERKKEDAVEKEESEEEGDEDNQGQNEEAAEVKSLGDSSQFVDIPLEDEVPPLEDAVSPLGDEVPPLEDVDLDEALRETDITPKSSVIQVLPYVSEHQEELHSEI